MPDKKEVLSDELVSLGVETLLKSVRRLGFNRAKKISVVDGISIDEEFALRVGPLIRELSFPKRVEDPSQRSLFDLGRPTQNSAISLRAISRKKRKPVDRHASVSRELLDETTLLLSSDLVVRGFRGVRFYQFLFALKKEVEWLVRSFGYRLVPDRILSCPIITEWHEYPIWEKLCLADGGTRREVKFTLERGRGRSMERGCAGYTKEHVCHEEMSLPLTA